MKINQQVWYDRYGTNVKADGQTDWRTDMGANNGIYFLETPSLSRVNVPTSLFNGMLFFMYESYSMMYNVLQMRCVSQSTLGTSTGLSLAEAQQPYQAQLQGLPNLSPIP